MTEVEVRPVRPEWKPPRGPAGETASPVPVTCSACGGDLAPHSLMGLLPEFVLLLPTPGPGGQPMAVPCKIVPAEALLVLKPSVCPFCDTPLFFRFALLGAPKGNGA